MAEQDTFQKVSYINVIEPISGGLSSKFMNISNIIVEYFV